MIGVAVHPSEQPTARELFELFKTPWEFYRSERNYEIVIATASPLPAANCRLTILFGATSLAFDQENGLTLNPKTEGISVIHAYRRFPLYGAAATFPTSSIDLVREEQSNQPILFACGTSEHTVIRAGYNLFDEIRRLLTTGQPSPNAGIPTLDLHLALLRDLITRAGVPLVEIPPVPAGYDFMACLTHDIDHPVIINHRWDHTIFGFLQRATVGSLLSFCRGRLPLKSLLKNWSGACRLPLVHLGLAKDFWHEFAQDYLKIEAKLGATYFVIPERDNPGQKADGSSVPMRACRYEITELLPQLRAIITAGSEVAVHGLDAWRDATAGRRELAKVSQVTGAVEMGVRMHWLYFDQNSPAVLEQAGFSYDSTVGYNDTVGYRAGTTQVYQPPTTVQLLELPLHVMDTALFYPTYLCLDESAAYSLVSSMIGRMPEFGGVLTFNWHDRSLAPDRLWGNVYLKFIQEMKNRHAWFPTATQAVAWFRKRRRATLEYLQDETGLIKVRGVLDKTDLLPGLKIRIHHALARRPDELLAAGTAATFSDERFDMITEINLS